MNKIESINKTYYERLYRHKHPLLHLVYSFISFDQKSKSRPNYAVIKTFVTKLVSQQQSVKVLDYGCGRGVFLLTLPKQGIEAYCYDISINAMEALQNTMRFLNRSVNIVRVDEAGQLAKNTFDLIVCSHVLEHVPSDKNLLDQFMQALQPGGCLLVNVPVNEVWDDPKHIRKYTTAVLEQKMTDTGFIIKEKKQVDKWTNFLLQKELASRNNPFIRLSLRMLRALLAFFPYSIVRLGEKLLLDNYQPNQLIMVGIKK